MMQTLIKILFYLLMLQKMIFFLYYSGLSSVPLSFVHTTLEATG